MNDTDRYPPTPARLGKPVRAFSDESSAFRYGMMAVTALGAALTLAGTVAVFQIGLVAFVPLVPAGVTALAAFLAFRTPPFAGYRVVVCEGGLSSRDLRPGVPDERREYDAAWGEVVSVQTSITTFVKGFSSETYETHTLGLADGRSFDLTSGLPGIAELGRMVQDEVFPRIAPRLAAAFAAGEKVDFGAIETDREGVKVKADFIPWGSLTGMAVENGQVRFHRVEGGATFPLETWEVKNLPILLSLVRRRVGAGRAA